MVYTELKLEDTENNLQYKYSSNGVTYINIVMENNLQYKYSSNGVTFSKEKGKIFSLLCSGLLNHEKTCLPL